MYDVCVKKLVFSFPFLHHKICRRENTIFQKTMFHTIVSNGKNKISQSFTYDWKKSKDEAAYLNCYYSFANTSEKFTSGDARMIIPHTV